MSFTEDEVEKLLDGKWVLPFDKESEMTILRQLDNIIPSSGVFWDVGAHAGLYSILCAQLSANVDVYSFEPSVYTRTNLLQRNVSDFENVSIVPYPLADTAGMVTYVDSEEGHTTNSLLSTPITPDDPTTFELDAHTAQTAVNELGVSPPDVVKIDVEGAEHRVLQGFGDDLMEGVSAVLCELHHIDGEDTNTIPYLQAHNFDVTVLADRETYDNRKQEHILATK
ncbi:FkbM family methyltransferase [Natronorubrum sp. JWXQ-INN-674]|uniref:FkbM family methyltransferase n=1 Tax=Natronorubrum halalkaliphilum TaxID=2691917 RepID=A0A6B0VL85_9EURY|nr:FkbM family methyltransferase [Natronorubrum halalkaliphilum]MXV61875.1 FkbM family methyltransferase [Natronorubrum halalkaliphilum]